MKARAASLVVGFLEALASERGASANTIEAYRRDLADYEAYLRAEGADALKAGSSHLEGYLAARGAQSLGAASLARRLLATAREGLDAAERPLRERLQAARMACLIELIYASGLRVSEVLSLKKSV